MKVAMYYNNNDIRIEEMPIPEINDDELLVKVKACGICGSDVMEWYRIKTAPRVLGHEVTGEVVKVGKNVTKFKEMDRVFVTHHVPCGKCRYCRAGQETVCETLRTTNFYPGGYSQFLKVPKINVEKGTLLLPDEISFEEGTFIEPLGCVVRGQRIAKVGPEQTVLVLGSGLSGLLHIQLAKALGAEKVIATDITQYRLDAAKKFGADEVIDARENVPEKVKELNDGRLADRIIVSTGALPAINQALHSIDRGGTILFFAPTSPGTEVKIPFNDLWKNCNTLTTTYAAARRDLEEALSLIKERKVNVKDMITHRLPLEKTQEGFNLVAEAKDSIKVVIEP